MESVIESALLKKAFGENIRSRRETLNLTLEELANAIGVTPGFLGLIERGRRGVEVDQLITLSETLKISMDELLSTKAYPAQNDNANWADIEVIFSYLRRMNNTDLGKIIDICKDMAEKNEASI